MSVNKHDVMKRWVETFLSGAKVSFDNIDAYQGARSLIPEYGEYLIKTDIVGNKTKQYTFGFVAIETLDQYDVDTNNTDTRQLIDGFNDWLVTQEKNKNYPDFGDDVIKYKIIPLYNTSNIAQVFTETNLAKYILMARIEYVEKE
jgi:hypothetical protein